MLKCSLLFYNYIMFKFEPFGLVVVIVFLVYSVTFLTRLLFRDEVVKMLMGN